MHKLMALLLALALLCSGAGFAEEATNGANAAADAAAVHGLRQIRREASDRLLRAGRCGDQFLADGGADVLDVQLRDARGVRKARAGGAGKVALRVRRNAEQIVIPQRRLLCLRHGGIRLVDALRHGVGFHIGDAHVDAELLERLGLAGNAGADLGKRLVARDVEK